jgi:hypothetical protein
MQAVAKISSLLVAIVTLLAFARYASFLSSLYPVFPEAFCNSGYGRLFETLLAGSLGIHLAAVAYVARGSGRVSLLSALLMAGALLFSGMLLFNASTTVNQLRQAQFDASCQRATGPLLLQVFTLAYVGPAVSTCFAVILATVGYRSLKQ